jgi:DNA-binding NarL/FixJ family response regulator
MPKLWLTFSTSGQGNQKNRKVADQSTVSIAASKVEQLRLGGSILARRTVSGVKYRIRGRRSPYRGVSVRDLYADGAAREARQGGPGWTLMGCTPEQVRSGLAAGLEVIRRMRENGIATPALILSALGEVDDRVRGLRAGGDDYLVKPFVFREMLARVDALARRSSTVVKEAMLRIGDLEIDLLARVARRRGRALELLPREFRLLAYLARNAGQVVSRTMLLHHVWDLHFEGFCVFASL